MNQESGRSMIEMIGVLGIMGVITAGSVWLVGQGFDMQKHGQLEQEVQFMVIKVKNLHSQTDTFVGLDTAALRQMNVVPVKNPYGGTYELAVDPSNSRQFVVSINGLSQSACKYFLAKAWSDSVGYQMSGGKNGGATGNCNASNGKNTISITYGD